MTIAFAVVVVVHGLIHLLGVAKAFGLADLPQLTQPVAPAMGVLWLIAAGLFLATAGSLFLWPRGWWALGAAAVVVSTIAIVPSWTDAKAGALVNLVVLAGVVIGFLAEGPVSLRASYDRQVDRGFADAAPAAPAGSITEADLAPLPVPVQRYLRVAGVVGQAPVRNFRARMHGRIRSGPDAPWMPFTAEQYNFYDPPARLFFMDARRGPIPFQAFHRYVGSAATMRVTVAALASVVNASGPEMTGAETVTLFNDMCVFAPATLVDPAVTWEAGDARTARAAFTHAGHTIRAELAFDEAGELADFWSDDRLQVSPDGATLTRMRWSTPLGAYRPFGSIRLASYGEGRWRGPDAEYTYIELHIDDVQYNVRRR